MLTAPRYLIGIECQGILSIIFPIRLPVRTYIIIYDAISNKNTARELTLTA